MEVGGKRINKDLSRIIHLGGLVLPIILVLYGFMVESGALPNTHFRSMQILVVIALGWVGIGIYQYLYPAKTRRILLARLIAYHALASIYLLAVTGLTTAVTVAWLVLILASFVFFGSLGLAVSAANLLTVACIDALFYHVDDTYLVNTTATLAITFAVSAIVIGIAQAHVADASKLMRSQATEEQQRDRTLTLINNLADAILSVNHAGAIDVFNAAALNLLDTNESLRGKSIGSIIKLTDGDEHRVPLLQELHKAKSVVSRDDLSATISGETIRLSIIYSPIRGTDSGDDEGRDSGYILILRDITKQKSLEEERDEFISVVSHELRTPITIAEGSLSNAALMVKRDDMPPDMVAKTVATAHEQVMFLARLVNDLSTLSRAERGVADKPEIIDAAGLVHAMYDEYAKQAQTKGLSLDLDISPQLGNVSASRLYLEELLQNFVTNAIKYTKEGGITIEAKRRGDRVHFAVHDTGIGISKSDQAHIFEKFYRAEDYRTRETSGTGLGLYVATKLARKLGTHIDMKSRLNHGSTFSFSLPLTIDK